MGPHTGAILVQLYQSDTREDVRRAVIQGLFLQNNGKALVDLARQEKDHDLKHEFTSHTGEHGGLFLVGERTADAIKYGPVPHIKRFGHVAGFRYNCYHFAG